MRSICRLLDHSVPKHQRQQQLSNVLGERIQENLQHFLELRRQLQAEEGCKRKCLFSGRSGGGKRTGVVGGDEREAAGLDLLARDERSCELGSCTNALTNDLLTSCTPFSVSCEQEKTRWSIHEKRSICETDEGSICCTNVLRGVAGELKQEAKRQSVRSRYLWGGGVYASDSPCGRTRRLRAQKRVSERMHRMNVLHTGSSIGLMRTERDIVLLEHAGGLRRGVRWDDGRVALAGEREGRVVDARELDTDRCECGWVRDGEREREKSSEEMAVGIRFHGVTYELQSPSGPRRVSSSGGRPT